MPRSNGIFTLVGGVNPVVNGTVISTNWGNPTLQDIASALTASIASNGSTVITSNLSMNNFKHTNVADPTARNHYATLGFVQDGRQYLVSNIAGTNNLTGTMIGRLSTTPLTAGMPFSFYAANTNTGPVTLAISGGTAFSILNDAKDALVPADLKSGSFYMGYYDGTLGAGVLITPVEGQSGIADQASTSGWTRPISNTYPLITYVSATQVSVPGGTGFIVPAGDDGSGNTTFVTWATQTVTITGLASAFSTTLAVNSAGNIIQYSGRISSSVLRTSIILGYVEHTAGVVTNSATQIQTAPAIFGDDSYLAKDMNYPLTNMLIAGGRLTRAVSGALKLDITEGIALVSGGTPNLVNTPNKITIAAAAPITFIPTTTTTQTATTQTAPVTYYDNAGTATLLAPNTNATIHRLYYLYGRYIWQYGQVEYADIDVALAQIEVDRSVFTPNTKLSDAVLLCEIIAAGTTADLNNAYIVLRGGFDYSLGAVGAIADAPIDGDIYGRKNGAWDIIVGAGGSSFVTDVEVTKIDPRVILTVDPVGGATWAGLNIAQTPTANWFNIESDISDDKVYFRSYDPVDGVTVRQTTIYDLVTGKWTFANPVATIDGLNQIATPLASATNMDIGLADGNNVEVTGTTTIQTFGVADAGVTRIVQFSGILTIEDSANILLPGATDITTTAGDVATFVSLGADVWMLSTYTSNTPVGSGVVTKSITGFVTHTSDGATVNLGHSLGVHPDIYNVYMECLITDGGYNVNDVIQIASSCDNGGSDPNSSTQLYADATNVIVNVGTSGIKLLTKGVHQTYTLSTASKWRFYAVALKVT